MWIDTFPHGTNFVLQYTIHTNLIFVRIGSIFKPIKRKKDDISNDCSVTTDSTLSQCLHINSNLLALNCLQRCEKIQFIANTRGDTNLRQNVAGSIPMGTEMLYDDSLETRARSTFKINWLAWLLQKDLVVYFSSVCKCY